MKNYYFPLLLMVALGITACSDPPIGDDFAEKQYVPEGSLLTTDNVVNGFWDLGDPDNATISFDVIHESGVAASSADIYYSFNGGAEALYSSVSSLPGSISVTMIEISTLIGMAPADLVVGDNVRFLFNASSSDGTHRSANSLVVPFSCKSELAGSYTYNSTSFWCEPGAVTGTVQLSEISAGVYSFDDWSFGSYDVCYGGFGTWGSLNLNDECNKISVSGVDNYGDSWLFNIVSINGADLTASWNNTYGETGEVILTKSDGDWPPLKN